jgi:hypothetical protein
MTESTDRAARWQRVVEQAKRAVEKAEDEAFEVAVRADLERVLTEIRAGRPAALKPWNPTPGHWMKTDEQ